MRRSAWLAVVIASACNTTERPPVVANVVTPPAVAPRPAAGASLHAWPVAPFSAAQLAEVKACDVEGLADKRYPKSVTTDALPATFAVTSTCDRAVLAAACGVRARDAAPTEKCVDAYRAVVTANPAFAFVSVLAGPYFGKVSIVAAPPATTHALVTAVLDYKWGGLGKPVDWKLEIHDASTKPTIAVTGNNGTATKTPADLAAKVAALGSSLDSLLPIAKPLEAIDCTDNYPEWAATLQFDNGDKLEMSTHRSNLIGLGGPWQLTVNGVTYLQLGPGFTHAVADLVEALGLAIGEPAGEMCRGFDIGAAILGG
jgi:hypothetical protein